MEKQNITLALPRDVLKRIKVLAAAQGTSVSSMLEQLLEQHLARHEGYDPARRRQSRLMRDGLDLGTEGNPGWTRDELHERE